MSHALLLRLFLSPYFSISVAMHYLKTYPDSIGISHYLCYRMKSMKTEDVEFYWPQMCHLLITRPTESNALESFILERAEESTHSAMLTFWFMQAALIDLTPSRQTNPRPFIICQRVLHRCHEIIFGDAPEPSRSPYRSLAHSPTGSDSSLVSRAYNSAKSSVLGGVHRTLQKVNPHVPPALVGMGVVLAASPGMPTLVDLSGSVAITQGRRPIDDETSGRKRVEPAKGADGPRPGQQVISAGPSTEERVSGESIEEQPAPTGLGIGFESVAGSSTVSSRSQGSGPVTAPAHQATFDPIPRPKSTGSSYTPGSATTPALFSPTFEGVPGVSSVVGMLPHRDVDPFGQSDSFPSSSSPTPPKSLGHQPFHSVPEFSTSQPNHPRAGRHLHPASRPPSAETLLSAYSIDAQRQLLRSHYCRSEVRFLLLLEDISNRLLVVPKPARVSALRAELTSLNHNLPAEVCMPMWCAADHSHEEGGETTNGSALRSRLDRNKDSRVKAHHRVVRISPGDSVVLNSAERAPFLLHVEILEGDLDFDPTRRENRELLKKIVVQEDLKKRKREGALTPAFDSRHTLGDGFGSPMPEALPPLASSSNGTDLRKTALESQVANRVAAKAARDAEPQEMEEMDLVEQLYGSNLSVRDDPPDFSESIPLPLAPRNKQLDIKAWDRSTTDAPVLSRQSSITDSPKASWTPEIHTDATAVSPIIASDHRESLGKTPPATPINTGTARFDFLASQKPVITLEDYSERMRTAAVMLAQLNASLVPTVPEQPPAGPSSGPLSRIPGSGWIMGSSSSSVPPSPNPAALHPGDPVVATGTKLRLGAAEATAIRERIMEEMMALEEERVARMTDRPEGFGVQDEVGGSGNTAEDEGIVRRELNKADPSAAVFKESWTVKKSRIRASSPWGHLANWDVLSVIVKTGADLRQEQLATQLVERFSKIWKEEGCECWVRFFRILITGESSGLVETITDAVSVHSIKKSEYARRMAQGGFGHVSLLDHYVNTYGEQGSGRFARAQRNFIKSLAGYSVVSYLLQIKDRHNGNILVDRDGHLIHIDFGFMLSNSPGNMGFEAAPFKMPMDYVEILGGLDSPGYMHFKKLFKEGFEAARKHSDSLITIIELMQKDSKLPCFAMFGENTAAQFRERFQLGLTTAAADAYMERLIVASIGSNWTRLYDSFQYYSQGVL